MVVSKMKYAGVLVVMMGITVVLLAGLACGNRTMDFAVTSSTVFDHNHGVIVSGDDLDGPPVQNTLTTTLDGAEPHTHTITLTRQDYEAIENGQEVTVVSSIDGNIRILGDVHRHVFVISPLAD